MQNVYTFFLKGMVCQRCISVIKSELEKLGIMTIKIILGEVTIITSGNFGESKLIEEKLLPLGFGLLEDKKLKTVNSIKFLVAEVYSGSYDFPHHFRFSSLLVKKLNKEYDSASALFASMENKTLERYILEYRIEKVREFLANSSEPLSEIAFRLNFSSVAHLSKQFKQFTGINPSLYRELMQPMSEEKFSDN